ncbi:hypothetical protein Syun_023119 [Stephania yunnanensis]|uniref:Uncharacterized protein n=1 Tax=Stephania yunnanensis TaxID=152371 RepID=A0AAP0FLL4_9MAGN
MEENERFNLVEEIHDESLANRKRTRKNRWQFGSNLGFTCKSSNKSMEHKNTFSRI